MSNETGADACLAEGSFDESDRPIHIGAIFILLGTSLLATLFPLVSKRCPSIGVPKFGILSGKHIGTGVILALAFIHLLPPAIEALGSECLPEAYQNYAYAPLFAMLAALAMQLLDNVLHGFHHVHASPPETPAEHRSEAPDIVVTDSGDKGQDKFSSETDVDWSRAVSTYLLELACTMHSVIIGITLGVASDEFKTLLAALTFHQFFEGFALGTRISDLGLGLCNELTLAMIYSLSAPVGIAIGVGIATQYNANSVDALLTQGIFDSVSAGILFYMAFVTLMGIDFREDTKTLGAFRKGILYCCVYVGAAVMAVIGTWL